MVPTVSLVHTHSLSPSRSLAQPHHCRRHGHDTARLTHVSKISSRAPLTHVSSVADTAAVRPTPCVAWCPVSRVHSPPAHPHTLPLPSSPLPSTRPSAVPSPSRHSLSLSITPSPYRHFHPHLRVDCHIRARASASPSTAPIPARHCASSSDGERVRESARDFCVERGRERRRSPSVVGSFFIECEVPELHVLTCQSVSPLFRHSPSLHDYTGPSSSWFTHGFFSSQVTFH